MKRCCTAHSIAHAGKFAVLRVTDTGTGMEKAHAGPHLRAVLHHQRNRQGHRPRPGDRFTGLCASTADLWTCTAKSASGTTFRVYLPLTTTGAVAAAAKNTPHSVRGGAETILVAEDHDGLRELARETLANLGYRVLLACDGEQAVREFQKFSGRIDLLVFDVMLPKRSGPEAYTEIAKGKPDVPVIFATGYSSDIALLHKAELQGATLLQKPYIPRDLARRVREALDQHVSKLNPV